MNKTCVRSKDNLNSVGHMPMLAGIEETQLLQKKTCTKRNIFGLTNKG